MIPDTPEDRNERLHTIGVWVLRSILAIGAIVAGLMGKEEITGTIVTALVVSFLFL